jgi:kynureninase
MISLDDARDLDAADPLRSFRDRFTLPEDVIYLDGNSLGALPRATPERLRVAAEQEWGEGLIRSWNDADWIGAPARVGGKIASLLGAKANEVVVADSTSANIFKLLSAAVTARPGRPGVLYQAGDFPTDGYMAEGLAALVPGVEPRAVGAQAIAEAIDETVAVVLLSLVHYKTAARWDMAALTARAHAAGALIVWDLSHAVGAIEIDLNGCGADMAVGCGYKFLNGGPGAPAFLFVAERLQGSLTSPLTGWMGHAAAFDFEGSYRPAPGIERFLSGTPGVLGLAAFEVGVDLAVEATIPAVETKSRALWSLFDERMAARCARFGFECLTTADGAARGSHIAYAHPEGYAIMRTLISRGVIGDFRKPDVLRFGLTPLYLGFEDVWRAVEILAEIMETEAWRNAPAASGRVT